MNILAIFAHPDDVEWYCGGTLLKYKKAGHKIYIALTTSGNTGSNDMDSREEIATVREAEMLESAKHLDAEVCFLRQEDEGLFDTPDTRRAVLTAIRWANPDVILTHNPRDYSTDHNMTSKLVTEVILSVGGKLHSADFPPIDKDPQIFFDGTKCFVDITEELDEKMEMLRCHKSQLGWMQTFRDGEADFTEEIEVINKAYVLWCGAGYAEGFEAHKVLGFTADYRLLP